MKKKQITKANEQQMDKLAQELKGLDDKQTEKVLWWLNGAVSVLKAQSETA